MNIQRRVVAVAAAVTGAVLAIGVNIAPASATTVPLSASTPAGAPVGILVQFKHGVHSVTANGAMLHQSLVSNLGISLAGQRGVGAGWRELEFAGSVSEVLAQRAASVMMGQSGVAKVSISRLIKPASVPQAAPRIKPNTNVFSNLVNLISLSAIKAASVPLKVYASDAFTMAKPTTWAVNFGWSKPKSLYGATLVGFNVQASFDNGVTRQNVGNFGPKIIKLYLNSGMDKGKQVSFRVAAITKLGKVQKIGTYSAWATTVPTGLPEAPQFVALPVNATKNTVAWDALDSHEAGGLPITYTAKASATGYPDVFCTSTALSCAFSGLATGVTYSVHLKAANKWGVTPFSDPWPVADPDYKFQWHLSSDHGIGAPAAWVHTMGSPTVTVAIVDSGITPHPDLNGQQYPAANASGVYGYDFVGDPANAGDGDGWDPNPTDETAANGWHGTHVMGIAGAATNDIGVVGVAPGAKYEAIRVLGANGGDSADLVAGLLWAGGASVPGVADNLHPAKVINLSLGEMTDQTCDSATQSTMQWLHDQGITVVTAAGNSAEPAINSYPGNCYPTINVGATGYTGEQSYYSNWGYGVDISAPGGDYATPGKADITPDNRRGGIFSTLNDGADKVGNPTYGSLEGTSMAAPVVTGVVALLYSLKPNLTPDQVIKILHETATPWPTGSPCAVALAKLSVNPVDDTAMSCGIGIVNADQAMNDAATNY